MTGLPNTNSLYRKQQCWIPHTRGAQCPVSVHAIVDIRSVIKTAPTLLDRLLRRPEPHATGAAGCFMWDLVSEYRIIDNGPRLSPRFTRKIPNYLQLVKS